MLSVTVIRLLFFDYFVRFRQKQNSGIKKGFSFFLNLAFGFKHQYFYLLHVNPTKTLLYDNIYSKRLPFLRVLLEKKTDFFTLIIFIVKNI